MTPDPRFTGNSALQAAFVAALVDLDILPTPRNTASSPRRPQRNARGQATPPTPTQPVPGRGNAKTITQEATT